MLVTTKTNTQTISVMVSVNDQYFAILFRSYKHCKLIKTNNRGLEHGIPVSFENNRFDCEYYVSIYVDLGIHQG